MTSQNYVIITVFFFPPLKFSFNGPIHFFENKCTVINGRKALHTFHLICGHGEGGKCGSGEGMWHFRWE